MHRIVLISDSDFGHVNSGLCFFFDFMCSAGFCLFFFILFSYSIVFLSVVIYRGDMPGGDGSSCNKEVPNVIASTATGVHNASSKKYP